MLVNARIQCYGLSLKNIYFYTTMLKRLLLSYVLVLSYAGAILHSVVPHHHHHTEQEAKEHHHDHHQHDTDHSHDTPQHHDHGSDDATYLFAHSANADLLVNHTSIDGAVKHKKIVLFAVFAELSLQDQTYVKAIFHTPPDEGLITSTASPFPALRAPPHSTC